MIWLLLGIIIAVICFVMMKKRKPVIHEMNGEVFDRVCEHCGSMISANDEYCPNCLEKVE